jgi:hypothetical protein
MREHEVLFQTWGGEAVAETHKMLKRSYGSYLCLWFKRYRGGHEVLEDYPKIGWLSVA